MKNFFVKLWDKITHLFFPADIKCLFCDRDVEEGENLCEDCLQSAPFNNGKRCLLCDMPFEGEGLACDFCILHHKAFNRAFAPFLYEGRARNAILKLKSNAAKHLVPKMASLMAERFLQENLAVDVVVPVPLSKRSLAKRKFNQSALLAREIGRILNVPVCEDALTKIRETKHQKELSFLGRQENLKNAFKVTNRPAIKGKNVLLVDDVITTCATTNECAKTLKKCCKNVYALAFARRAYKNLEN